MNVARPEMEDIVPGVSVSLLNNDHLGSQQLSLNGSSKATRSSSNDKDPRALTRLASVVALGAGLLVQLGPQRLGLPCLQMGLEFGIEEWQLVGLESEHLAQVSEK